jgi:hypothetical protein
LTAAAALRNAHGRCAVLNFICRDKIMQICIKFKLIAAFRDKLDSRTGRRCNGNELQPST